MRIFAHSKRRSQPRRRRFTFEQLEIRRLFAGEIRFTNLAGDFLWSKPSNWDQNRVPLTDDIAIIDLPGNQTVTVDSAAAVAQSIVNLEKLAITGTLNVPTISGPGTIELRGGSLSNATVAADSTVIGTSSGGRLTSVSVQGDLDLSRIANANIRVYGGLSINGNVLLGDTSGSTYGRLFFGDSGTSPGLISGTATIVLGGSGFNYIENSANIVGAAGTLTIGSGITIRGKNGWIYSYYDNGSILNQGVINTDVTGGMINIAQNSGRFTNTGSLNVSSGGVTLYGTMTLAGLGVINRTGGTINLGGTLDLESTTWNLNTATGPWNLLGGTVRNGTIRERDGVLLVPTASGGRLMNTSVDGDLDLSRVANAAIRVYGGLNINGNVLLGDTSGSTYGRLFFGDSGTSPGLISGTATIVLGGSGFNYIENSANIVGAAGTLTIGSGITIRGKNGWIYSYYDNGSILNQGVINTDVTGGMINIAQNSGRFTNTGSLNVSSGGVTLYGTMTLAGLGVINRTGGTINLGGTLDLESTTWNLNTATGPWNLLGGTVRNGTIRERDGVLLVPTASGGRLMNTSVDGDLDLSRVANAAIRVYGGLNINGNVLLGDTSGSTYGRLYFGDSGTSPGSISGTATIVLGGSGFNYIENSANIVGAAGTLTIGSGITIRGKNGWIYSYYDNGSILNQGVINTDVTGGMINIAQNSGRFTNTGSLNVSSGGVTLYGTMTLAGLGVINRTGGTINLGGTLDLESTAWNLNTATGPWNLLGGTVRNGTIRERDGVLLVPTASGGRLMNTSVDGDLDLSRVANAAIRVYGGLNINGNVLLGDTSGSTYGRLFFGDSGTSPGLISGIATIVLGGSGFNYIENSANIVGAAGNTHDRFRYYYPWEEWLDLQLLR